MKIAIYGAQAIALGTYYSIKTLHKDWIFEAFIVSDRGANAELLSGIPVYEVNQFYEKYQEELNSIEVWIATPEGVFDEIEKCLTNKGIKNYKRIDSLSWGKLMKEAFSKSNQFCPLATLPMGKEVPNMKVFKAKHLKDKELLNQYFFPTYIEDLQVGASLSEVRISNLCDDTGENISDRNGNYSEITGLYWIWKNVLTEENSLEYVGLAHYRRRFNLCDDEILRIKENQVDVILPFPMPYDPSMEEHHKRYLTQEEWKAVLMALEEISPAYARGFEEIKKDIYMVNYNVILAKKAVLREYCEWLFPILFRVEELCNVEPQKKPNRYMGYVAETLETLYFFYNKDRLNIAYETCEYLC